MGGGAECAVGTLVAVSVVPTGAETEDEVVIAGVAANVAAAPVMILVARVVERLDLHEEDVGACTRRSLQWTNVQNGVTTLGC